MAKADALLVAAGVYSACGPCGGYFEPGKLAKCAGRDCVTELHLSAGRCEKCDYCIYCWRDLCAQEQELEDELVWQNSSCLESAHGARRNRAALQTLQGNPRVLCLHRRRWQ